MIIKIKTIIIIVLAILLTGFSALALYIYQNQDIHLQKSKNFFFSSDYLSAETIPTYDIYGGSQQSFSFELKNFEDSLRFSDENISYNIETVGLQGVIIDSSTGSIVGGQTSQNKVTVTIPENYTDGTELLITAESMPYYKKLSAKLKLHKATTVANYYVEDSIGNAYAKLIICAEKEFVPTVNWTNGLDIDCTNPYIVDNNGIVNPLVETKNLTLNKSIKKGESIAIYFFKSNSAANYSKSKTEISTAVTQIAIGN